MENDFKKFIEQRPSICKSKLAKELAIDRMTIEKILIGMRKIPKPRRGDFFRIMQKYGYIFE
jgi:hypothetical protein